MIHAVHVFATLALPELAAWKKVTAKAARAALDDGGWNRAADAGEHVTSRATVGSLLKLLETAHGAGEAYLPLAITGTTLVLRGRLPEDVYEPWAIRLALLVAGAATKGGTGFLALYAGGDDPAHVEIRGARAHVAQYDPQNLPDAAVGAWLPTDADDALTAAGFEAWQQLHRAQNLRRTRAGRWGWLGADGAVAIEPTFGRATDFAGGLAAAMVPYPARYGLVDPAGGWAVAPRFTDLRPGGDGRWCFEEDGRRGFLDATGAVAIPAQWSTCSDFAGGLAAVEVAGSWGFIDAAGTLVIAATYTYASAFAEDRALIGVAGRYGFIDRHGATIVAPTLATAALFADGRAPVHDGTAWGFVDAAGALVIPHQFAAVGGFAHGRAIVVDAQRRGGVIDRDGRSIVPTVFHFIQLFENGDEPLFRVSDTRGGAQRLGLVDLDGHERLPAIYRSVSTFCEGLCMVQLDDGTCGYVDRAGATVIAPRYAAATDFVAGRALVRHGPTLQIIDPAGAVLATVATPAITTVHVELSSFSPAGLATFTWGPSAHTLVDRDGTLRTGLGELASLGPLVEARMRASWAMVG